MNFKTLLWKEYRQSRLLLATAAGLLAVPYVVVTISGLIHIRVYGEVYGGSWARNVDEASSYGLVLSLLLCSFMGGNAIAGERADRSAEFLGYLPISRIPSIVAKAVFALSVCTFLLVTNGLVAYLAIKFQDITIVYSGPTPETLCAVAAIHMFGVSWALSAITSRPAIAAVLGLASAVILGMIVSMVEEALGHTGGPSTRLFAALFGGVGSLCFIAGVVCYLRRVEP